MMVALKTNLSAYFGDICEEIRLFYDVRKISCEASNEDVFLVHEFSQGAHKAWLYQDGIEQQSYILPATPMQGADAMLQKKLLKRESKICVYRLLCKHFGHGAAWGSLTGVRPTKLMRESIETLEQAGAEKLFSEYFDVPQ